MGRVLKSSAKDAFICRTAQAFTLLIDCWGSAKIGESFRVALWWWWAVTRDWTRACSVSKDISKAPRSLICHNVCLHEDQKDRTPCTASSKVSLDRCWCICIRMWPDVVMSELNHYKSSSCCPAHLHILDTPRTYQRPSLCAHGVQREFPKL